MDQPDLRAEIERILAEGAAAAKAAIDASVERARELLDQASMPPHPRRNGQAWSGQPPSAA